MDYQRLRSFADQLADFADQLEEGWSFEIGRQGVVVMMSPVKRHEGISWLIGKQLNAQLATTHPEFIAQSGAEVESPALGRMRRPDVVVLPEQTLLEPGATVDPAELLAVVEIVSESNPENDYHDKMEDYPAMRIPLYLLVDPRRGTIEVHSDPEVGRYQQSVPYIFGDTVALGPWTIDTSRFPRYQDPA